MQLLSVINVIPQVEQDLQQRTRENDWGVGYYSNQKYTSQATQCPDVNLAKSATKPHPFLIQ